MKENLNDIFLKENKFIFKKYKPIRKIGEGSFGKIYSVIRLIDQSVFAMKTEKINTKEKMIESEAFTLYYLQKGFGIPKLISYGVVKNYNILIETLLGESLENIFIKKELKCNIIDVCSAGIQIIDRLEWIHSNNLIYRDIKPENFLVGIKDPNVIYIIDFGLCKKYRSSKTGKHILPKTNKNFFGNIKFSSSNVIKGKESSRRDDIISLGYMLIYFIKKGLPWDYTYKTKINSSKLFELIYLKETNAFGKLFNGLQSEFNEFIKYATNLKFEEDPNYSYLRGILKKIINNNNFIKGRYNFNCINNTSFYSPKSFDRKKSSLHQRVIHSLEEKRYKQSKSENQSNLKAINKLSQINYSLCTFNSNNSESKNKNYFHFQNSNYFDSSLYNYGALNNSKKEEKISKNDNYKTKKIFSKTQRYKYIIQKCPKTNINTLNNFSFIIKENNNNKIMQDSLLRKKISLINKQKRNRMLVNSLSISNSQHSNSNNPISFRNLIPKKNLASPINLPNNNIRNNNIIMKRIQLLYNKSKNIRNNIPKVISEIKLKNSYCHNSLYNNRRVNEKMKIKHISFC